MSNFEHLEKLILDLADSLTKEIANVEQRLEQKIDAGFASLETRFDVQAARLDRQAALIQTGSRWTARINDWAEKIDQALEAKDRQINDLSKRIKALEDKP